MFWHYAGGANQGRAVLTTSPQMYAEDIYYRQQGCMVSINHFQLDANHIIYDALIQPSVLTAMSTPIFRVILKASN